MRSGQERVAPLQLSVHMFFNPVDTPNARLTRLEEAPQTDRSWSPCRHDARKPHFRMTPGWIVTDGEPHATAHSRCSRSRTLGGICSAMRFRHTDKAGTARSNRWFDSTASRRKGCRRLHWWRHWHALEQHCRNRRNGECLWARAGESAWSRNQSRDLFAFSQKTLEVSSSNETVPLAAGNVETYIGTEVNRTPPEVTRPMIRLLWFLLATGPHPPSYRSNGALESSVVCLVPQPLPQGGDMADKAARTRPCAYFGVTCLVGGAAWRRVAGEAIRLRSKAPPGAVSGTPPDLAHPPYPATCCATNARDKAQLGRASAAPRGAPWGAL